MKCVDCRIPTKLVTETIARVVGGHEFRTALPAHRCSRCDGLWYDFEDLSRFDREVAQALLERGAKGPGVDRFVRKVLGEHVPAPERTWRETLDALASSADTRTLEGRMTVVEWEGIRKAMHMLSLVANNGGKPVALYSPAEVAGEGLTAMVNVLRILDVSVLPISTVPQDDGGPS